MRLASWCLDLMTASSSRPTLVDIFEGSCTFLSKCSVEANYYYRLYGRFVAVGRSLVSSDIFSGPDLGLRR